MHQQHAMPNPAVVEHLAQLTANTTGPQTSNAQPAPATSTATDPGGRS